MAKFFSVHAIKLLGGGLLASLAAGAVLFALWQIADGRADLAEVRLKNAKATITSLKLDRALAEKAAAEAVADDIRTDNQRRELNDAANTPGDSPIDRRIRRPGEIAVGEHHRLWGAGGPRGIDEGGRLLGLEAIHPL